MDTSLTLNEIYSELGALNDSGAFSSQGFKYLHGTLHSDLLTERDSGLIDVFEEWHLTNDTKKLEKDLRNLIRAAHRSNTLQSVSAPRIMAEPNREAASPLGDFLNNQKRNQRSDWDLEISLKSGEDLHNA